MELDRYICFCYEAEEFYYPHSTTSWLRHCATSRKVAGSIPNEVIGFFN
jgi:hypothetical protein